MIFILIVFVSYTLAYPPPVLVKDPIQITSNLTKEFIIQNHMKYSNHPKYHHIPMIAHVTRYHERNPITLPIFAHLFDGIAFDHIMIKTINNIISVVDQNPYKNITIQSKKIAILKTEMDSVVFSMELYHKIQEQITGYDGILFDSSIPKELTKQIINYLPQTFLKYKVIPLGEDVIPYQSLCDAVFIDTQYFDPSSVVYQPLQPMPWIEEQISKHFGGNKKNGGFIVDFEGKMYCKHSTTHLQNLPYLRFIKKLNVTITYHPASHEHSIEAPFLSDRYMDDYCYSNYPTPYSLQQKLTLADKYNMSVLFHDFGGALDYFFDVL
ncbi:hypothetical protein EHI8A_065630 [Entamoeba histolytica HM-1:IMSS-B]|uniref:Uncharacterized protein n=4 Tax=Entamoeba histolytica TaxID=5759 RepID=B1N443_ENTH1|nr:hypothetical protein EHI_200010 [Entamoeba histolytica HM-1:IMSS]EDS89264.1 hypothetical protein EHI_200010 [Entamoeba histolytica HM-1:IMSS]EMH72430.1 hypothetical protein EHI8A_065630 [Entamoeba histolytica HM-1:IMSS-B]ENY60381.1 hypothetical protein EHI7A_062300 [Entamoeba histolytica HM-1:IMSS-A]GAT97531.1 hypothetical protein CL6EHI_200010 [Entamoeba histolytica]|eukprot:XP_001913959.1 hypothetical protein EHI_200010 [Entamoeba histolytica HM-1:IMSS]